MATVRQLEGRIERIEGFRVQLLHPGGRDVRGDRANLPQYGYERAASDGVNVRRWKDVRFTPSYSGWDVEVLDSDGNPAHGRTLLSTVRATYRDS
jgi:hypothetical protein